MKVTRALVLLVALAPAMAWPCSPYQEPALQPEQPPAAGELIPDAAPEARVSRIVRGRPPERGEDSCTDLAYIAIAIRDKSPGRPYVYSFEAMAGDTPDAVFFPGLFAGQSNGEGEQVFHFYWADLEASPRPFDVTVRITPHSRSGTPGPAATLVVRDGR